MNIGDAKYVRTPKPDQKPKPMAAGLSQGVVDLDDQFNPRIRSWKTEGSTVIKGRVLEQKHLYREL